MAFLDTEYSLATQDLRLRLCAGFGMVGVAGLVVFVSGLRSYLEAQTPARSSLGRIAYAGGLIAAGTLFVGYLFKLVAAEYTDHITGNADLVVRNGLDELSTGAWTALALVMAAVAVAALRYAAAPRWLGWGLSGRRAAGRSRGRRGGSGGWVPARRCLVAADEPRVRKESNRLKVGQSAPLLAAEASPPRIRVDWARAAVAVSLGAVLAAGAAAVLHALAPPGGPQLRFADFVVGVAFPLAGALVLRREPRNAAGRLLVFAAVVAAGPLLNEMAWRILRPGSGSCCCCPAGGCHRRGGVRSPAPWSG